MAAHYTWFSEAQMFQVRPARATILKIAVDKDVVAFIFAAWQIRSCLQVLTINIPRYSVYDMTTLSQNC